MLHSKKFFDLLRVGCCFYNCLSFSHFFLISLPAVLPTPILLPHHTYTHAHTHTHTHTPLFLQYCGKPAPCPRAVPWAHGWWLPIWLRLQQYPNPRCQPRLLSLPQSLLIMRFLASRESPADSFKMNHIELMIPFTGFDNYFLISQRIYWQITAVHQNWILKFKIK